MEDFAGQVAIVTGGTSGLGRAIALGLARRGAKAVVLNYANNAQDAEECAALVRKEGAEPILVKADVATNEGCQAIAQAAAPFGKVDALFNNAGITRFVFDHSDLDALSADDFATVYGVNVIGAYQMTRAARALLEATDGQSAIVNTGSLSGITGYGSSIAYAASKAALATMTISLARALAPKIRVNIICPGLIDTPWFVRGANDRLDDLRRKWRESTLLHVVSDADDVADPALFLASRSAAALTGEMLVIDGGALLK